MQGFRSITPRISHLMRDRLNGRLAREVQARHEALADPRWDVTWEMRTIERVEIRAAARAHLAGLRERGELLDTLDVLMTHAVRRELERRGWDCDWPPVPAIAPRSGRWPGSMDGNWPEKITARIPAGLADQVHAACWHTSAAAIAELREWRDRNPEVVTERRAPTLWAQYVALAEQVTTPGRVWREALHHILK